jgi:NAD(P)-dependent dehydrogenase (short-subunit alcohol dehydrogenase family)
MTVSGRKLASSIVVSGAGSLGRAVVSALVARGVPTVSVDLVKQEDATHSVMLETSWGLARGGVKALDELRSIGGESYGSVFHAAGG